MTDSQKLNIIINKLEWIDDFKEKIIGIDEIKEKMSDLDVMKKNMRNMEDKVTIMQEDIQEMKEGTKEIIKDINKLKENVSILNEKANEMDENIRSIYMIIENNVIPQIKVVAEGHCDLFRRFKDVVKSEQEKELFQIRLIALENEMALVKKKIK